MKIRAARRDDLDAVCGLCRDYRALLIERSRDVPEFVATYYGAGTFEELLSRLEVLHAPPHGTILVAESASTVVGVAMLHRVGPDTCEIKRVFVSPTARGTGAGRALFEHAFEWSRGAGYRRMVLDTFHTLHEAIGLYHDLGFRPCEPFYDPDPGLERYLRFFERPLSNSAARRTTA